ncbi:MAG: ribonuclease E/G [Acetatifactor sp.]
MSRNIKPKDSVKLTANETNSLNSYDSKLIFSDYKGKVCAFLIQANRLTSVFFPESSKIGSIYICKVKNIVKAINACFVEIAGGEICFLPLKDAMTPFLLNRKYDGRLLEGDELPVQIVRAPQKTKQASVTAEIAVSNEYFVLTWGKEGIQYSQRLNKEQIAVLEQFLPEGIQKITNNPAVGVKVRTKSADKLNTPDDFRFLLAQYEELYKYFTSLLQNASHRTCFSCLSKPQDELTELLQNQLSPEEYNEILTEDRNLYDRLCKAFREQPLEKKIRLYKDSFPLEKLYGLNTKLEEAISPRVWLKCGGYLIIQHTEALTVIDVNSGKYEGRRGDIEQAALKVNKEAAEEIALQLKLRNISGIIIVDFINLKKEEHRRELLNAMRAFVQRDRTKTVVVDMTPLGLVEITRKKVNKPLLEYFKNLSVKGMLNN